MRTVLLTILALFAGLLAPTNAATLHFAAVGPLQPTASPQSSQGSQGAQRNSNQSRKSTGKKRELSGKDWLIDIKTVKSVQRDVQRSLTNAIKKSGIAEAQARVEAIASSEDKPDPYELLEAVTGLRAAYTSFQDDQAEMLNSIDAAQQQMADQLESVHTKVAGILESGGIDHRAQIQRAEDSLASIAVQIRRREAAGFDSADLRRYFARILSLQHVLRSIEDDGTPKIKAVQIAAQVKGILEGFLGDLEDLESQLAIAEPVLNAEVLLLDLFSAALQAEIAVEELKGDSTEIGIDSEFLSEWIGKIGSSRGLLSRALDRTPGARRVTRPSSSPQLNDEIARYAKKGGYEEPKQNSEARAAASSTPSTTDS